MSVQALFTFMQDEDEEYHVFKEKDGHPHGIGGAIYAIYAAAGLTFPLPRYEADSFAAAFIATQHPCDHGTIRLVQSGSWRDVAPELIAYRYTVYPKRSGALYIDAYSVKNLYERDWSEDKLFSGNPQNALAWADQLQKDRDAQATALTPRVRIRTIPVKA